MTKPESPETEPRTWIARSFTLVEDVVYIGLGLLLSGCAIVLLGASVLAFVRGALDGTVLVSVPALLDRILLILLVVEVLYTVQVSFREHALKPEPFLLIGLISAIRRVLVVTAELGDLREKGEEPFRYLMIEVGVLTVLIVALTISLVLLRKFGTTVVVKRE